MAKTILVVEDDEFLLGLEQKKIEAKGYEVITAKNSEETFKALQGDVKIDLMLLDLLLPEIDGFQILDKMKKEKIGMGIPVVVFSNLSEDKDIAKANQFEIEEYIVKSSTTLNDLMTKIDFILK